MTFGPIIKKIKEVGFLTIFGIHVTF